MSSQNYFSADVHAAVVNGAVSYSGPLTFIDRVAGDTFKATIIASSQITEIPPVAGPTSVNGYFSITGKATLNTGTSADYYFTAGGSLPYPANTGSTGGIGFTVTGPNGFTYNMPWHGWDKGETVSMAAMPPVLTSMTLSSSANPSVFEQPVTFTAHVMPGATPAGAPVGNVSFSIDAGTPFSAALSNGQASFATTRLSVGSHTITASYAGTSLYAPSGPVSLTQVVGKASTTTTLGASGPLVTGPLTLSATVAANAPSYDHPTGTVTFYDGTAAIGTATLPANASSETVSISLPHGFGLGEHHIHAVYGGDASTIGSTTTSLNLAPTSLKLVASGNISVFGQYVTYTATVTPPTGFTGPVGGSVGFVVDQGTPVPVTVGTNGQAVFYTSHLSVGSHTILATFLGTSLLGGSQASLTEVVKQAATSNTLSWTGSLSVGNAPVTLSATVAVLAPSYEYATGTVTFYDGTVKLGTVTLAGNASSQKVSINLPNGVGYGSHQVFAVYSGDTNTVGSQTAPIVFTNSKTTGAASPAALDAALTGLVTTGLS